MAFFGKLGGLLRQNAAQSVLLKSGLGVVAPTLRGISSSMLLIDGGPAWESDENKLRDAFGSFGLVTEVESIVDREGRSMGFATVKYSSPHEAEAAHQEMDGRELAGRQIRIKYYNSVRDSPGDRYLVHLILEVKSDLAKFKGDLAKFKGDLPNPKAARDMEEI